jgi:hypothetical protein
MTTAKAQRLRRDRLASGSTVMLATLLDLLTMPS